MEDRLISGYRKSIDDEERRMMEENAAFIKKYQNRPLPTSKPQEAPPQQMQPAAPKPTAPQPQQAQQPQEERGYLADMGIGVVGGMRDSVQDFIDAGQALYNFSTNSQGDPWQLPNVETKTLPGNLVRGVTDFLTMFIPFSGAAKVGVKAFKVAKMAEKGSKLAKTAQWGVKTGMIPGAAADALQSPQEGNLFNMLAQFDNPVLNNTVLQYMKVDKDDGQLEARIKNIVTGAGLGGLAEGIFSGIKYLKASKSLTQSGKGGVKDAFEAGIEEANKLIEEANKLADEAAGSVKAEDLTDNPAWNKNKKVVEDLGTQARTRTDTLDEVPDLLKGKGEDTVEGAAGDAVPSRDPNAVEKGKLAGQGTLLDRASAAAREMDMQISGRKEFMRSVPEDLISRDLDELTDIREFAATQGAESVDEYLQALVERKNPLLINVAADVEDGGLIKISREGVYSKGDKVDIRTSASAGEIEQGVKQDLAGSLDDLPMETPRPLGGDTMDDMVDRALTGKDDPIPKELPTGITDTTPKKAVTKKPKRITPKMDVPKNPPELKARVEDITPQISEEVKKTKWGNKDRTNGANRIVKDVAEGKAQGVIVRDAEGNVAGVTSYVVEGDTMIGKELFVKEGGDVGVGSSVVEEVMLRAKEMGLKTVKTIPYSPEGRDADLIKFYKRLGFQKMKKEKGAEGANWWFKKVDDTPAAPKFFDNFRDFIEKGKGYPWNGGKLILNYGEEGYKNLRNEFESQLPKKGSLLQGGLSKGGGITRQGGFANVALMGSLTSGVVGGVGTMYMSDNPTLTDFAIGFAIGGSIPMLAHGLMKLKGTEQVKAFDDLKVKRLDSLNATEEKLTSILKRPLSKDIREKIEKQLASLKEMRTEVEGIKDVETIVKHIQANPENAKKLTATLKPRVKVREGELDAFMGKMVNGDFDGIENHIDIDITAINDENEAASLFGEFTELFLGTIKDAKGLTPETWDVTTKLAVHLGDSMENVNSLYSHTKGMAHKGLAALALGKKLTNGLNDSIRTMMENADNSAKTILSIRKQAALVAAVNAQIKNYPSEVGRALNSIKLLKQFTTSEMIDTEALEAALAQFGGREKNTAAIMKMLDLKNAAQKNLYASQFAKNPSMNFVMEMFYGALLSNPATWGVNALSGAFTTAAALFEKGAKGFISGGAGWHEGGAMWHGIKSGWNDALKLAVESFKKETPMFDVLTKVGDSQHAITSELLDHAPKLSAWMAQEGMKETVGHALDLFGNAVRGGSRVLMATDVFWKVVNHRMSLHSQAYEEAFRQTTAMGLKGKALADKTAEMIQEMVSQPSTEFLEKAIEFARKQTFTNPLRKDENFIQGIGSGIQNMTSNVPAMRFMLPFVRVATNISSYVVEHTPVLNLLSKRSREALMHGTTAEKQTEMAKLALGGMMVMSGVGLVENGFITGGGAGRDMSAQRQAGWQPYSFKVGDKYFSYSRIDPLGSWLGIVADYYDLALHVDDEQSLTDHGIAMVEAFVQNFMSKQYLQGFSELTKFLNNPGDSGQQTLSRILSSFVPSGVGGVASAIDPTIKETRDLMDKAIAKIPGLKDNLPPKRDMFGEPTARKGWRFNQLVNPFTYGEDNDDPTYKEIGNLRGISPKNYVNSMKQMDGFELSPEQQDKYVEFAGRPLKQSLDELFKSEGYKGASDGGRYDGKDIKGTKQELVQKLMNKHKMNARMKLIQAFPELREVLMTRKKEMLGIKFAQ